MEPTHAQPPRMTPNEALQRLQFIYDCARRAPLSADEHDRCKTVAQELAAILQPKPTPAPALAPPASPAVEAAAAPFVPKDASRPVSTKRGGAREVQT